MNAPDEIDELVERFPRLFRGQRPPSPCALPAGWVPVVNELFSELDGVLNDTDAAQFQVRQIKEKLGGLRVYWWLGPQRLGPDEDQRDARSWYSTELHDRIVARIRAAEDKCDAICQNTPTEISPRSVGGRKLPSPRS